MFVNDVRKNKQKNRLSGFCKEICSVCCYFYNSSHFKVIKIINSNTSVSKELARGEYN